MTRCQAQTEYGLLWGEMAACYLYNLSATSESGWQLRSHHSVAQDCPVASITLRVKSKCLTPTCKVLQDLNPARPASSPGPLSHITLQPLVPFYCPQTHHHRGFVFSLPGTCLAKTLSWFTPSHHSLVPAQQLQKTLLPPSLRNLLTHYQLHNPLINCITYLFLKVYFLFIFAHIYWVWQLLPSIFSR